MGCSWDWLFTYRLLVSDSLINRGRQSHLTGRILSFDKLENYKEVVRVLLYSSSTKSSPDASQLCIRDKGGHFLWPSVE